MAGARGIALFTIEYRLVKGRENLYPASVHDTRAALQYVRANARELSIDPERIGLMGASAGGHLSTLVALQGIANPSSMATPTTSSARRARASRPSFPSARFTTCWPSGSTTSFAGHEITSARNILASARSTTSSPIQRISAGLGQARYRRPRIFHWLGHGRRCRRLEDAGPAVCSRAEAS